MRTFRSKARFFTALMDKIQEKNQDLDPILGNKGNKKGEKQNTSLVSKKKERSSKLGDLKCRTQLLTNFIDKFQRVTSMEEKLIVNNAMDENENHKNEDKLYERVCEDKEKLYEEHKTMGLRWCSESIGGSWSNISEDDFVFKQLTGGLTNILYTCELSDNVISRPCEPRKVLLRVYGDIAKDLKMLVKNSVVFCLLSEKQLGPKCYGFYTDGRLEEFIPTTCLKREDLLKRDISAKVAKKLAIIHNLDMPLCKEPRFLSELVGHWLAEIANNTTPESDDPIMQKISSYKLESELEWLLKKISDLNSPVVFSHNDLQEGNLLFLENSQDPDKELTVIDLEYASYNYRGFDFGNHFCEWCYDYQSVQESPYYSYDADSYPTKPQQFEFFRSYLEAQNKPCTDEELESLYIEANTCALASHLMWAVWSIVQKDKSDIEFGYMDYAVCRLDAYFKLKARLFP